MSNIPKTHPYLLVISMPFPGIEKPSLNFYFQVRKSFFNDLNINNNVTIVDLLYQQFYTGSETNPSPEEQEFIKSLFTSGKCTELYSYRVKQS
jgi:hypothetical protein